MASTPMNPHTRRPAELVMLLQCSRLNFLALAIMASLKLRAFSGANGVEPFAYLQHVLLQLPYLGKTHSH